MRLAALVCAIAVGACSSDGDPPPGDTTNPSPEGGISSQNPGSGGTTPGAPEGGPAVASCKRGVAYGHHSEADLRALSTGISWWYNWAFDPDKDVSNIFPSLGVDYVPMVWGKDISTSDVGAHVRPDATSLLGFNEPNFTSQANIGALDAAARWPAVQAIADAKNLRLLSPAVNFCGGGCNETNPFEYLSTFLSACKDCRVDALAIHIYVACKGDGKNHAQWLIDHVKEYEAKFTQPLWLTEFACDDAASEDEQKAFMIDAVTYLESDPRIERYAWFSARADNVPHVDLLGASGELSALGQTYVTLPHDAACGK